MDHPIHNVLVFDPFAARWLLVGSLSKVALDICEYTVQRGSSEPCAHWYPPYLMIYIGSTAATTTTMYYYIYIYNIYAVVDSWCTHLRNIVYTCVCLVGIHNCMMERLYFVGGGDAVVVVVWWLLDGLVVMLWHASFYASWFGAVMEGLKVIV